MDEVKVLEIQESPQVGRWVLATIGGYDDSVRYDLTFAADLSSDEWAQVQKLLPAGIRVDALHAADGAMLGRKSALLAEFQ